MAQYFVFIFLHICGYISDFFRHLYLYTDEGEVVIPTLKSFYMAIQERNQLSFRYVFTKK